MSSIQDLLALLDHWPLWKRIKESPPRLDDLEKRIADLEAKLAPATGEVCQKCRTPAFHVVSNRPMPHFEWAGKSLDKWLCDNCGDTIEKPHPE